MFGSYTEPFNCLCVWTANCRGLCVSGGKDWGTTSEAGTHH